MTEARTPVRPAVGFIGLGDQGLPAAAAIGEAAFAPHASDRRPHPRTIRIPGRSEQGPAPWHDMAGELAASCDLVRMCVRADADVLRPAGQILGNLRPGAVVDNHGTGLPSNAVRLTERCAKANALDAPVSGGRSGGRQARRLTTMVGRPQPAADRYAPVFQEAVAAQYRAEQSWLHQSPTTPAVSTGTRKEQHS